MARRIGIVLAIVVGALIRCSAAQTTHVVGDSLGWLVPPGGPIAYSTWASLQTFTIGDTLVFNFYNGNDDVAKVTKAAYDACNGTNPISLMSTSPANFTLDSEGEHYFISTFDRHCALGQKLAINVTASSGPVSSPPASTPSSPRTPVRYVVGDSLGWIVPPGGSIAYSTWAYNKKFMVGDTLVFNFYNGSDDVAKVTKAAYDACNGTNPISLMSTSPANFTLDSEGEHYFISTFDRHCALGQKLAINVTASSGPVSSPPPSPPSSPRSPVRYVVGDSLGWLVPPGGSIAYSTWAYNKKFMVGDILVFNFANGTQDVAQVTKAAFESCNSTNPISLITTGPASITLESEGEHYYICTYRRQCPLGQKLAINVTARATATTPSGSAIPPSGSATASEPTAPPPFSSAPSVAVAGFSVSFLSVAIAFLF